MSKENNIHIYILVAILIIMIAVIAYLMYQRRESPPSSGNGGLDSDPDTPPGYTTLKYDDTRNEKKYVWELGGTYYATLLSGGFKVGGKIYTNVRTYARTNGKWEHVGTNGGWPGGYTTLQHGTTINMRIDAIKFEAEQGILPWVGDRYMDEIHVQLMVEVP